MIPGKSPERIIDTRSRNRAMKSAGSPSVANLGAAARPTNGFHFAWTAPVNESFRVDFSSVMPPMWTAFTNIITSTNGAFDFTDDGLQSGGLTGARFYRVRTGP